MQRGKFNFFPAYMAKQPPPPFFVLRGHEGQISALHFTTEMDFYPNQAVLLSGSDIGEIFIWNMKTFRTEHRFRGHNFKKIMSLHYYKTSLISQARDGFINVWQYIQQQWKIIENIPLDSTSMGFCSSVLLPLEDAAHFMYFNEDRHLLKMSRFKQQLEEKEELKFKTEYGMCFCIKAFHINGKIFVLAGFENGYIRMWDIESKDEICHNKLHRDPVICMDFDFEHKCMGMSGSVNHLLEAWKLTETMEIVKVKTVEIKNRGVEAIKIRYDGKIVITAGLDCSIRVFSWKTLKLLAVLQFHELAVQCVAFCPVTIKQVIGEHKSVFASGSKDQNICLWDIY